MAHESQAGALDRSHAVGCPRLRDPQAPICFCTDLAKIFSGPMRSDSKRVYQNIAAFRKLLAQHKDLPAELLREMLERTLVAAELLMQSTDRMQDLIEYMRDRKRA